jgi:CBS domain-containing protein
MHVTEVVQFLQHIPPFSQLPAFEQQQVAAKLTVYYASHDEQIGFANNLVLVRTGLFFSDDQQQLHPLQSGDFWGYAQILTADDLKARLRCQEDGLVYSLADAHFQELRRQYKNFDLFFQRLLSRSLHLHQTSQTTALRVEDL